MMIGLRTVVTPDLIRGLPAFAQEEQGGSRLKAGMTVELRG
jgi:hypothetical protein